MTMGYLLFFTIRFAVSLYQNFNITDEWKFVRSEDGIDLYLKEKSEDGIIGYKCIMTVPKNKEKVVQQLEDVESYTKWQSKCSEARLLHRSGDTRIYYLRTDLPWPLDDRDMVIESKMTNSPSETFFENKAIDYNYKPYDETVRVRIAKGKWTIKKLPSGNTSIEYLWEGKLDKALPDWLLDHFLLDGPLETMQNLKKL